MIAFTFPGQGSQKAGMGLPWLDHPSWEVIEEASDATGRDIAHLLTSADQEMLSQTRNTQLVTYAMSMLVLDAVERIGVSPSICAGHSLGEYCALVAAGSLPFDTGAKLVAERAEAMQLAAQENPGGMAALLGIDDDGAEKACDEAGGDVWVANYNAPGQVVLSGAKDALAKAIEIAKNLGAKKAMVLPVNGAFHTPYMEHARQRLRRAILESRFYDAEIPVIANVDAFPYRRAADWIRLLAQQLTSPVMWTRSLNRLRDQGTSLLVEIGPGNVLTGLAKRTTPDIRAISIQTPDDLDKLIMAVEESATIHVPSEVRGGEHLYAFERIVVSPAAGVFTPSSNVNLKDRVRVGDPLGEVSGEQVRSAFEGHLSGYLAADGERVIIGQPVAWLRTKLEG
ncbi:MAG: ACP S-malonyltransferase [Actinomycetota bacterium]|nr:ACP S-malonyltransferase [Actinomycetota bacterium]